MRTKTIFGIALLLAALCSLPGCDKSDGEKPYGLELLYMPQAAQGTPYTVPSGEGEYTRNFKIEDGTLKIMLGIMLSGSSGNRSYTVDVLVNTEASQKYADKDQDRSIMPAIYDLPEKVSVSHSSGGGTFYLSIPVSTLKNANYDGKKLVLCVQIANPSGYELAPTNCMTTVVVDVDKVRKFFNQ